MNANLRAEAVPPVVARPLPVLIPLIETDLAQGRDAAAKAALPYYRAAGEKLLEAKSQIRHGQFTPWVKRYFKLSAETARQYMRLAEAAATQNGSALPFSSISDFIRQTTNPNYNRPTPPRTTVPPQRLDVAALTKEKQAREAELLLTRELARRIVDVGYKALAMKLHPDKGGPRDVMIRLNNARDVLRRSVMGYNAWR